MIPLSDCFVDCVRQSVCPSEHFMALTRWLLVDRSTPLPDSVRGVASLIAADQDRLIERREAFLASERDRVRRHRARNAEYGVVTRTNAEYGNHTIPSHTKPILSSLSIESGGTGADAPKPPAPPRERFSAPSVDEVRAYCDAQGFADVDAAKFVDYYTAKGWRVGKAPMKDWMAAVRTWHRREAEVGAKVGGRSRGVGIYNASMREEDYGI